MKKYLVEYSTTKHSARMTDELGEDAIVELIKQHYAHTLFVHRIDNEESETLYDYDAELEMEQGA